MFSTFKSVQFFNFFCLRFNLASREIQKTRDLVNRTYDDYFLFFRAVDQLSKLDGARLFAMSRTDLIAAFGKQEGQRLDSQITISRNSAGGYQTARTSELKSVLNKARKRSEFNREKYDDQDQEISVA